MQIQAADGRVPLKIHNLRDLYQKPAVVLCQFENQPDGEAGSTGTAFVF
jgi:hypothetical protein